MSNKIKKQRSFKQRNRKQKSPVDQHREVKQLLISAQSSKQSGNHETALKILNKALILYHDDQELLYQLAVLNQETGETQKAIQAVKSALAVNPLFTDALRLLAELDTGQFNENYLSDIKKAINDPHINENDRANLAFTLFEIYEKAEDYETSFEYLTLGNRSKRTTFHYDFNEQRDYLLKVRSYLSKCYEEFREKVKPSAIIPIFIVGMPRSGTTLVEQILASHPAVTAGGELSLIPEITKTLLSTHVTLSDIITSTLEIRDLRKYKANYINKISKYLNNEGQHITDKMPQNFLFLGLIKTLFPTSKILHCTRHPMATAFSCYKTLFTESGQQFSFDLTELGQFYLLYRETMAHWHAIMPGHIYNINYEELIADQEEESRKILDFCDLTWDDRCLSYHNTKRIVTTASSQQVIKPIYKSSLAHWKNYRNNLRPLLDLIGDL